MNKEKLKKIIYIILAVCLAIQLIPIERSNPPIKNSPIWDSPRTMELAKKACWDCHSNETNWPKYSYFAPFSWFLVYHVNSGRSYLNFSDFKIGSGVEASLEVKRLTMPLPPYLWMHPAASLTNSEKLELIRGLEKTFGKANEELQENKYSN